MPNTESNLPTLSASSWLSNGTRRPKACSTNTRVSSPCPEAREELHAREDRHRRRRRRAYLKSTATVLTRNDGRPPIPTDRGRNPLTKRPPGSVDATSPREFTAGANVSTP